MRRIFGRIGHTCGLSSWQEFVQYAQRNRLQMYIRYTGKQVCKIVPIVRKSRSDLTVWAAFIWNFFIPMEMEGRGYRMRIVSVFVSVFA